MWMLYKGIEEEAIMITEKKMQHTARAATSATTNNQKKCKYCGKQHFPKQCPAFGQTCRKYGKKNHWGNCSNARIIGENQTTEDYVIQAVTKEVGKKTMKAEVQNEVKKIRNKVEQANEKIKKNKQQNQMMMVQWRRIKKNCMITEQQSTKSNKLIV